MIWAFRKKNISLPFSLFIIFTFHLWGKGGEEGERGGEEWEKRGKGKGERVRDRKVGRGKGTLSLPTTRIKFFENNIIKEKFPFQDVKVYNDKTYKTKVQKNEPK